MTESLRSRLFSRRDTLTTLGAGAIGAVAAAHALPALATGTGRKPNFLFIMADDLGYADLSSYGRREYSTPVLDGLAAQGTRFTHGYANSAVCSPTRIALITGRYHYRVPAGLHEPLGGSGLGLEPAHPTLPSLLKAQGYHSALIGKWHMGNLPDFGPLQSGYDEFWGNRGGGIDYFTHSFGDRGPDLWDGDIQIEEAGYYTDMLAERSLEFLDARAKEDKPWLLSLHFTAPHWPWQGPGDKAESDRIDGDIFHYDGGSLATYAEMVTALDAAIGRVLDRLTRLGLDQDTVVVFTSDNGGERFSDNWPFSGIKSELLEGGIRVPLIVRWPGAPGGMTSEVPVLSMDFLPTFLAAAGGASDPAFPSDGIDIRPALSGAILPDRPLFWRFGRRNQKAVRLGQYKYLSIDGNEFLFDIVSDPRERANLKDRQPEVFADLRARFQEWDQTMLTDPKANSYGFNPDQLADHFGPIQER